MPVPVLCIGPNTILKDIEDAALGYYDRVYSRAPYPSLSVNELLAILKRFQNSPVERNRKIFHCVLKMVFDEQIKIQTLSKNKIIIIALLFGGFIGHGFLSDYGVLDVSLRIILDALKTSPESKAYVFGITALDQFKCRLKDLRHYCTKITNIPHFQQFPPHLIEYLEWGKNSQQPPPSRVVDLDGVFANSASNNDTEPVETIIEPTIDVQNKIIDIINELSLRTMRIKSCELRCILTEKYLPWFAQYLVTRRVPIEKDFHEFYRIFLYYLNNEYLNSLVLFETYKNIKIVLESYTETENNWDRLTLENLGYWLGVITLRNNIPISVVDLDLKMLLFGASTKSKEHLLCVVKFIAKILESCTWSNKFTPYHPWTKSIIKCLDELHLRPDVKSRIKRKIELLYRHLDIEISGIIPARALNYSNLAPILNQRLLDNSANRDS